MNYYILYLYVMLCAYWAVNFIVGLPGWLNTIAMALNIILVAFSIMFPRIFQERKQIDV